MRTPKTRPGSRFGGEGGPPKEALPAWAGDLGRRRTSCGLSRFVERYPEILLPRIFSPERGCPVLPWARFAFMVFCCACAPGERSCVLILPVEQIFGGK